MYGCCSRTGVELGESGGVRNDVSVGDADEAREYGGRGSGWNRDEIDVECIGDD